MINVNKKQKLILVKKYKKTALNALIDKVAYVAKKKPAPYPRLINLFITERCNFACPMCHVKESRQDYQKKTGNELTLNDLMPLIKEAGKYGAAFQIIGGEPLLNRDIIALIKALNDYKIPKGLTTNGLLLEKYARDLVEAGLDFLSVSLDGYDEEHQFKRGHVPGSFEAALKGIKKILEIRGNKLFPNVRVASVVAPINIDDFEKILDVARKIGADQWSISHYFYYYDRIKKAQEEFGAKYGMGKEVWGDYTGEKKEFYSPDEIKKIQDKCSKILEKIDSGKIKKIAVSIQRDIDLKKYYQGAPLRSGSICTSPYQQVFIRGNGDVEMCQGYILGNIKKERLADIWNNNKSRHFRKVFKEAGGIMPSCFRCCAMSKFKF